MIKVKAFNEITGKSKEGQFNTREEVDAWISRQESKQSFGKPERYMLESEMSEMEKRRVKSSRLNANGEREFLVKADYIIKLQELSMYKENRMQEYPSIQEIIEAVMENFEGRPQKLNAIKEQRALVKRKYPKLADGDIERRE